MVHDTDMWHYEWNMGLEMLSNLGERGIVQDTDM